MGGLCSCYYLGDAGVIWSDLADLGGRCELLWHGMVFKVPQFIVDGDGGWCVTCDNVAGEGDNVAVERGPVGV